MRVGLVIEASLVTSFYEEASGCQIQDVTSRCHNTMQEPMYIAPIPRTPGFGDPEGHVVGLVGRA